MASASRRSASRSRRHIAEDPDGKARSGERVAPDDLFRDIEQAPDFPNLILEQLAEGLDQVKVELLGSPPTLWCVLIVADGPLNDTLSMTSG